MAIYNVIEDIQDNLATGTYQTIKTNTFYRVSWGGTATATGVLINLQNPAAGISDPALYMNNGDIFFSGPHNGIRRGSGSTVTGVHVTEVQPVEVLNK